MTRLIVLLVAAWTTLGFGMAGAADLVEGKEYLRLKNPQPVESGTKIEVIEFFSYGCPHCNDLEPFLQNWLKTMPADVQFRRVPVMYQERWVALAKIFYTLDAMGEDMRLSPEVFSAVHSRGLSMWQDKVFFDWAAGKGLDRNKVAEIYASFGINSKINRAKVLANTYNVQAVPTLVVDGKFVTESSRVGTHAKIPPALDALIAKARAERHKG